MARPFLLEKITEIKSMPKINVEKYMDDSTDFNLKQVKKSASSQENAKGNKSVCAKTEKAVHKIMTEQYGDN